MDAKTNAQPTTTLGYPKPTRHLGDLSFYVITMHEPALFASQISTSELLGPAVLRRTPYVLLLTGNAIYDTVLCLRHTPRTASEMHGCFGMVKSYYH